MIYIVLSLFLSLYHSSEAGISILKSELVNFGLRWKIIYVFMYYIGAIKTLSDIMPMKTKLIFWNQDPLDHARNERLYIYKWPRIIENYFGQTKLLWS